MTKSIIFTKSKAFALRVVRLYKYLRDRKESVITMFLGMFPAATSKYNPKIHLQIAA